MGLESICVEWALLWFGDVFVLCRFNMAVYSLYLSEHSFDIISFKAHNSISIMAIAKSMFFDCSVDFGCGGGG